MSHLISPTDMGAHGWFCHMDDEAAKEASKQEIIRRHYQTVPISK